MRITKSSKAILGAVIATVGWACLASPSAAREKDPVAGVVQSQQPRVNPPADLANAIVDVAKRAIPAVAHVEVTERRDVENPLGNFGFDPFFQRFFGTPGGPKKFHQLVKGLGSGIVMEKDGYILTNAHVVAGATKIEVVLSSGQKYDAKVVGIDPKTDLAVIKIPGRSDLPILTFGDSDKLEVGQWVIAIGHPRGLDETVTQGIISAKHRTGIADPSNYEDFLQTDAAINPGNSGGPLLNLAGHVIGVNAMIATESGGSEGIGFAIPSNMATRIAKELIAKGKVERGWLGVTIQDLTPDLAHSLGLKVTQGALVGDVTKGSPAEQSGMRRGDVITSFAGEAVHDSGTLRNKVANTTAGETVEVRVLRKAQEKVLKVKIGDLASATKGLVSSTHEPLGVAVRPVTKAETSRFGLDPNTGVAITGVDPKGVLGQEGFEKDDIILEVNGRSITTVENFADAVNALQKGQKAVVLALDHRTGRSGYVQVVVP